MTEPRRANWRPSAWNANSASRRPSTPRRTPVGVIEEARVGFDDPWRMICLPPGTYSPLQSEGSPWHRHALPDGRMILAIHRADLYRLALDVAERDYDEEKVSDTERVLYRRLLHPEEREEIARVTRRVKEAAA